VRDLPEKAVEVPAEIRQKPWAGWAVDTGRRLHPVLVVAGRQEEAGGRAEGGGEAGLGAAAATDPDREGESISWHLREILKPEDPGPPDRVHEITEEAIQGSRGGRARLDENLVSRPRKAAASSTALRLHALSPVLWKKVATGLSAGRVPERRGCA